MQPNESLKVNVQFYDQGNVERATISSRNVSIYALKQRLFGRQANNLISIELLNNAQASNNMHLATDQASWLSSLKQDRNAQEVTVTFKNVSNEPLAANPITNINEHDRLIAALKKSTSEVLVLVVGAKVPFEQQEDLSFSHQLNSAGHHAEVFNLDYRFQDQLDLESNNFGVHLDPTFLKTKEVLQVLQDKAAQGKKIILFDNSSIKFTDFTNLVGTNANRYGLHFHDNLEILVGRGAATKGNVPIVFCDETLFQKVEQHSAQEDLVHNYPFQPQGPTYKSRAKVFVENFKCELFPTVDEIPVSHFFANDNNFQRYPHADILAALARVDNSRNSIEKFLDRFNQLVGRIHTVTDLHKLLPIFENKYIAQYSSKQTSAFFSGNTQLTSYLQDKIKDVLSKLPVLSGEESERLEISQAVGMSTENRPSI